ncbi:hypothetical protein [Lewinella sp. IMCC34191]|uniref:hypothetical protein n=1 Tax=Lewinella sp. IMCC34191 TaxID=2259172 RepID=UPI000E27669C|nr:hypothetical protein [Lewinella sp. IMCC34191]
MPEVAFINDYARGADRLTRRLIYLYIFLLFFEGALRKWFLPFLAGPLTIIRDPLMIVIIFTYLSAGYRLLNFYTLTLLAFGLASFVLTLGLGHQNLLVDIFGLRTLLLHFFLIFIAGNVLSRSDVEKIGRYCVYILPLMTLIIGLQFYSPQSAWINRGVGGDMEGAGFSGAMGYMRPSGTFSFTNGSVTYFSLAAAFLFYFLSEPSKINRIALIAGFGSAVAAIPLSISRTYMVQFALSGFFFVLISLRSARATRNLGVFLLISPVIVILLSTLEFFQTSLTVLTTRFEAANSSEGGLDSSISNRFLGGMTRAFTENSHLPWHGEGLGMGTNVAATILTGGRSFLLGEGEWSRVVGEMGPFLGIGTVLLRAILSFHLLIAGSLAALRGNALPFMLLSFGFLKVLQGGWSQPTSHGFSMIAGGLIIASLNDRDVHAA